MRGLLLFVCRNLPPYLTRTMVVALHFTYYNFCRIHKTLGNTPAMAAGVSDHIWTSEEIVKLADSNRPTILEMGLTLCLKVVSTSRFPTTAHSFAHRGPPWPRAGQG